MDLLPRANGAGDVLKPMIEGANPPLAAAIKNGVSAYVAYCGKLNTQLDNSRRQFAGALEVLQKYVKAEGDLFEFDPKVDSPENYRAVKLSDWNNKYQDLAGAKESVARLQRQLAADYKWDPAAVPARKLDEVYADRVADSLEAPKAALNDLLKQVPGVESPVFVAAHRDLNNKLADLNRKKEEEQNSPLPKQLKALNDEVFAPVPNVDGNDRSPRYLVVSKAAEDINFLFPDSAADLAAAAGSVASADPAPIKAGEPPADWTTVKGRFDDVAKKFDFAEERFSRRAKLKGSDPAAIAVSRGINRLLHVLTDMVEPMLRYKVLREAIDQVPQTASVWAARTASASKDKKRTEAEFEMTRPAVPLSKAKEQQSYALEYDPDIVKVWQRGRRDLMALLSAAPAPPSPERSAARSAPPAPVPSLDVLNKEFQKLSLGWNEYTRSYVSYWANTVIGDLEIPASTWGELHRSLAATQVFQIENGLATLGQSMRDALRVVADDNPEAAKQWAAVKSAVEFAGGEGAFHQQVAGFVAKWKALPADDLDKARQLFLTDKASDLDKYTVTVGENQKHLIYWGHLSDALWKAFEGACQPVADRKLNDLRQFDLFPLVPPGPKDLDPNQVDSIKDALEALEGGPEPDRNSIALLDNPHAKVIKGQMKKDDVERIRRLHALQPVLPTAATPLKCQLTLLEYPGGPLTVPGIRIRQGDKVIGPPNGQNFNNNGKPMELGTILCPGDPLKFEFGDFGVAPRVPFVLQKGWFDSPWSAFYLIRDAHNQARPVNSLNGHSRTWEITFPVQDPQVSGKGPFQMHLQLKLDGPGEVGNLPDDFAGR